MRPDEAMNRTRGTPSIQRIGTEGLWASNHSPAVTTAPRGRGAAVFISIVCDEGQFDLSQPLAPENGQPEAFSPLTAPGAALVLEQLLAQDAFSAPTAPGAAVLDLEQLESQLLAQEAFSPLTAPGAAALEQLLAQLLAQDSEPTAPGAAEADLQQPSVPQQAAVPPEAPGEAVLLLLQPTSRAATVRAAIESVVFI